jgi:gamma-glutamyltranspeptidase/glutathione hydrolase
MSVDLHTVGHRRGVVCAPHQAAVEAGRMILSDGGNAIEAMIAMAATVATAYPHMSHLGGDAFWLWREPGGRVRVIMAAGRAGTHATRERYREYDAIPPRGPLAALTVPGTVAGWILAHEAARAHGSRQPLAALLSPAIQHARQGCAVTKSQARHSAEKLGELKEVPGFAQAFLIAGKSPEAGDMLKQPALAATLEQLCHAGLDDFYRGDVGHEIAADLDRVGSPITRADLEACLAELAEPLSLRLDRATLYNTPPPTQGLASLLILGLFERLRVNVPESFDYVHGIIEASKRALLLRDRVIADPDRVAETVERYLQPRFLEAELLHIDHRNAATWPHLPGSGDTVWMGAADASGLTVSYIQSLYWEFGSGVVLPRTGVLMQNRGASFSLKSDSINALEPGRIPFHTLNPALAELDDGRIIAYGTMGGDGQPQTQAALFTRYAFFRQPLDHAIDAPRWLLGRTWGATRANLRLESRFDPSLVERLEAAGHDVEVLPEPYSEVMGHAGAVVLHPAGSMEAAHDPRADGAAAGV